MYKASEKTFVFVFVVQFFTYTQAEMNRCNRGIHLRSWSARGMLFFLEQIAVLWSVSIPNKVSKVVVEQLRTITCIFFGMKRAKSVLASVLTREFPTNKYECGSVRVSLETSTNGFGTLCTTRGNRFWQPNTVEVSYTNGFSDTEYTRKNGFSNSTHCQLLP